MADFIFCNQEREEFFLANIKKCKNNDNYHKAFFYVMGLTKETRTHIQSMFDYRNGCIKPAGMYSRWQTSTTAKVYRLAFNLWNGYTEEGYDQDFTPEKLFCCELAPYFMKGR